MAHEGHDHDDHGHHHHHDHGHHEHAHHHHPPAPHAEEPAASVAVLVVTLAGAGQGLAYAVRSELEAGGHGVAGVREVQPGAQALEAVLADAQQAGARAVVLVGGTGLGRADTTVEALEAVFDKRLPGFAGAFAALAQKKLGAAGWRLRVTAGTWQGLVVFALPAHAEAVRLAVEGLVAPEVGHAVRELMGA